jgi:sarcosine oxidase subunit beta
MVETADVIVIGAGVQGASLAFHLARRGVRSLVLERSSVASGATGRSSGLVRMHYDLAVEAHLAWESFGWFRDWSERVGGDCGFTRTGFLFLVGPKHGEALRANVDAQRALGIATSVVGAAEIRRIAPDLFADDDTLAAHEPESGYADPSATTAGFLRAAREGGARFIGGCEVTGIRVVGGRVAGVDTNRGPFDSPIVVDAAGGWAARVAGLVGLDLPLTIWRHDTAYLGVPAAVTGVLPVVIDDTNDMYFRPEGHGQVLIGLEDDNELGGDPDRPTNEAAPGFPAKVAERICRRIPAFRDATFRSAHSGQDGLSPDQRAILGPVGGDGPDGFFLQCGFSGTGFKTAPAVGLAMSEWILDGAPRTVDIRPFGLGRFAAGRPLVGEHPYGAIWR